PPVSAPQLPPSPPSRQSLSLSAMQSLLLSLLVLLSVVRKHRNFQNIDECPAYDSAEPARGVNMMQQGYGMSYRQNRLNTRSLADRIKTLKDDYRKNDYRGAVFG
ncbi:hypothetical protein PMAYCL1PPCAC_14752, partial [Pristionchus mayeri]